ncbi:type-F conjugative transfer system protein TraW [Rickettsia endosymbiont of Ixodes scapularis]|nr:type-F conjugative transfer system protein TraW [Rickettsia endosymbiont of Ixodes scapularis]
MIFSFTTILAFSALALENKLKIKDYGVRGATFQVIEQSMLEVIMAKLKAAKEGGLLEKMQEEFKEKVKKKIARPLPVLGLHKAIKARSWKYDPTFTQQTTIKDQNGRVIVPAGTKVNPLVALSWGDPLILIDGDDASQVAWAKAQQGKIVLTNGSPIELSQTVNREIYFDQGGMLATRFKIEAIPAIIEQDGKELRIREVAL